MIVANGKPREVAPGTTLGALIESFGWKVENVVVERNGEPVPRAQMRDIPVNDGDVLEIVRAVAGG
jgi:thiamine biosynthesis protein ThiS